MAGISCSSFSLVASVHNTDIWVIDSGATDHVCNSLHHMHNLYQVVKPIFISLPNGQMVSVTHIRSTHVTPDLTLSNVFFVPHFQYNLLSISKPISEFQCQL